MVRYLLIFYTTLVFLVVFLMVLTFLLSFIHHTAFALYSIHPYYIYFVTQEFRRKFETPILRGQDAMATQEEQQKGQVCLEELAAIVNRCLIRRTSALLSKYLPVKIEQVICIRLTDIQQKIYSKFLASDAVRKTVQGEIFIDTCHSILSLTVRRLRAISAVRCSVGGILID